MPGQVVPATKLIAFLQSSKLLYLKALFNIFHRALADREHLNAYVSVCFSSMKSLLIAPIMFDTAWPFVSYLSSKEFTVSIGQHVSFCGCVICGVAQGSPVALVLLPWYMLTLVHTIWHLLNRANHLRLMASITVFCCLAAIARCTYNGGKTLLWTLCRLKRCFRTVLQLTG